MEVSVNVSSIFNCTLERAFKSAMLCDVTKLHTGYLFSPKVTHTTEDSNWGKIGSTKKIHVAKSMTQKGGFLFIDKILERVENDYWKIEISEFQTWTLGFYKFVGEWKTTQLEDQKILIDYSYTLHSNVPILYPLNWLLAKTFWKTYMKRVMENIRTLIDDKEPYLFE